MKGRRRASSVWHIVGQAPDWAGRGLKPHCQSRDQTLILGFRDNRLTGTKMGFPILTAGRPEMGEGTDQSNEVPKTQGKP